MSYFKITPYYNFLKKTYVTFFRILCSNKYIEYILFIIIICIFITIFKLSYDIYLFCIDLYQLDFEISKIDLYKSKNIDISIPDEVLSSDIQPENTENNYEYSKDAPFDENASSEDKDPYNQTSKKPVNVYSNEGDSPVNPQDDTSTRLSLKEILPAPLPINFNLEDENKEIKIQNSGDVYDDRSGHIKNEMHFKYLEKLSELRSLEEKLDIDSSKEELENIHIQNLKKEIKFLQELEKELDTKPKRKKATP